MTSPHVKPRTGHDRRTWRERAERKFFRGYKAVRQRIGPRLPRTHVFVAGMQRSGTNMLMELLDWNRHTDVYHETDPRAFTPGYEMRAPEVIHALAQRSPAPFFVIKSLCELDRLRDLLDDFAPAKAVWIVRDYRDSSRSAVRSFGNFVPQLRRLARDKSAGAWRGRGMSDETQAMLREMASLELSELDGAALMWYYRNILYFEQGLDKDPRVKLLSYEGLVANPHEMSRDLCGFMGVSDWSPWMVRYLHVGTSARRSIMNVRPEVNAVCDGLINRFEKVRQHSRMI